MICIIVSNLIRWLRSCRDPPTCGDYLDQNYWYFDINDHKQYCSLRLVPVQDNWKVCFLYPRNFTRRELYELANEIVKDDEQEETDNAVEYVISYVNNKCKNNDEPVSKPVISSPTYDLPDDLMATIVWKLRKYVRKPM